MVTKTQARAAGRESVRRLRARKVQELRAAVAKSRQVEGGRR